MAGPTATRLVLPAWLAEPATRMLIAALAAGGVEARFVGGAVRDTLAGRKVVDIDLATPEPPERVAEILRRARIKVVPTGIAHGTVTAVVPPRAFEITTLRRDVATDGRHARVAFDADWASDAARRDFTINALYLAPDGTLDDFVGGRDDLAQGRVRFVGDPARRIAEDVLRLLRYYRFEAHFGRQGGDRAARAACRAAVPLLAGLSAERVAHELMRLLAAPQPVPALQMMREDGALDAVLPEAGELAMLGRLAGFDAAPGAALDSGTDPLRRLAALAVVDEAGAAALARRLRLSNAQAKRLCGMARPWPFDPREGQRHALYRLGLARYRDLALLSAAAGLLDAAELATRLAQAARESPPVFPLAGRDVAALGIPPGKRVGRLLEAVRHWWEEGGFVADQALCRERLAMLAAEEGDPAQPAM